MVYADSSVPHQNRIAVFYVPERKQNHAGCRPVSTQVQGRGTVFMKLPGGQHATRSLGREKPATACGLSWNCSTARMRARERRGGGRRTGRNAERETEIKREMGGEGETAGGRGHLRPPARARGEEEPVAAPSGRLRSHVPPAPAPKRGLHGPPSQSTEVRVCGATRHRGTGGFLAP